MTDRIFKITMLIAILILMCMLNAQCENGRTKDDNISALQSDLLIYKLRYGQKVASVKTLTAENKTQALELLGKDKIARELIDKFAKVKTVTKIQERIVIDTIAVAYKDTVPCVFERKDKIQTKEYSFDYRSTQGGISINNLTIPDTVMMVSGTKRKWFLGRETQTFDITHSNKYVQTDQIQHIEIKPKKRFYQTDLFKVGAGILAGFLIAK